MSDLPKNHGWTVNVYDDRERPGMVKIAARSGARIINLERIDKDLVDRVDLEVAWNRPSTKLRLVKS